MQHRRKNILPIPNFQIKLVVSFLFLAMCCGVVQYTFTQNLVSEVLANLPSHTSFPKAEATSLVLKHLLLSLGVMTPIILVVGTLITFRFAGPIFKIEKYLLAIGAGENPGPCKLRNGDQLSGLCDALNVALETVRKETVRKNERQGTPEPAEPAPQPTVEQS